MSRGVGLLMVLAGAGLVLDDSSGAEARRSPGLGVLLLVVGSGLLLARGEEDHP